LNSEVMAQGENEAKARCLPAYEGYCRHRIPVHSLSCQTIERRASEVHLGAGSSKVVSIVP
jgi:hypothetical protein